MNVVSTTSRNASKSRETILSDDKLKKNDNNVEERLTTLDLDVTNEDSIMKAAKSIEEKFGKGKLRLLINVSGIVSLSYYLPG